MSGHDNLLEYLRWQILLQHLKILGHLRLQTLQQNLSSSRMSSEKFLQFARNTHPHDRPSDQESAKYLEKPPGRENSYDILL